MDFNNILFMHWYIWSMLWPIHIIFPNFSTELWPLIDLRILFMFNILWNNWWIWPNLLDTLIFFYTKTCATTKISTVAGYHVVLAMLFCWFCHAAAQISRKWGEGSPEKEKKNNSIPIPKIWAVWFYISTVLCPKAAKELANCVDCYQTATSDCRQ